MTVTPSQLESLYAQSDDPWGFASSPYEQEKFAATRNALAKQRYRHALELGCGNGELARHLAPLCARYTGLDAVEKAIRAARRAVPDATFVRGFLPGDVPEGPFDLVILSEILYFLSADGIAGVAVEIRRQAEQAELICVTYLGDTTHELQGKEAFDHFVSDLVRTHRFEAVCETAGYRIDRAQPRGMQ